MGPTLAAALLAAALVGRGVRQEQQLAPARELAARLSRELAVPGGRVGAQAPGGRFLAALTSEPDPVLVDALPFYDEAERAAFARSRWVGDPPSGRRGPVLAPPYGILAVHESGSVSVHWEADPATTALVERFVGDPLGQRVAYHVYRGTGSEPPAFLAEVSSAARMLRDLALPLARSRLTYQVWAVLLGPEGRPVAAEAGDLVSLEVPERFRVALLGGDPGSVRVRVDIGPPGQTGVARELVLSPGQPLVVDGQPTGLTLHSITQVPGERLETRRRVAFRSDGTLVLDPATGSPRMSEVQVLVPIGRLVANLTDSAGASRTLELDLP